MVDLPGGGGGSLPVLRGGGGWPFTVLGGGGGLEGSRAPDPLFVLVSPSL